jgi:hypothetical protein
MAQDDEQWQADHSGPWSKLAYGLGMGWFKIDGIEEVEEFRGLPWHEQEILP